MTEIKKEEKSELHPEVKKLIDEVNTLKKEEINVECALIDFFDFAIKSSSELLKSIKNDEVVQALKDLTTSKGITLGIISLEPWLDYLNKRLKVASHELSNFIYKSDKKKLEKTLLKIPKLKQKLLSISGSASESAVSINNHPLENKQIEEIQKIQVQFNQVHKSYESICARWSELLNQIFQRIKKEELTDQDKQFFYEILLNNLRSFTEEEFGEKDQSNLFGNKTNSRFIPLGAAFGALKNKIGYLIDKVKVKKDQEKEPLQDKKKDEPQEKKKSDSSFYELLNNFEKYEQDHSSDKFLQQSIENNQKKICLRYKYLYPQAETNESIKLRKKEEKDIKKIIVDGIKLVKKILETEKEFSEKKQALNDFAEISKKAQALADCVHYFCQLNAKKNFSKEAQAHVVVIVKKFQGIDESAKLTEPESIKELESLEKLGQKLNQFCLEEAAKLLSYYRKKIIEKWNTDQNTPDLKTVNVEIIRQEHGSPCKPAFLPLGTEYSHLEALLFFLRDYSIQLTNKFQGNDEKKSEEKIPKKLPLTERFDQAKKRSELLKKEDSDSDSSPSASSDDLSSPSEIKPKRSLFHLKKIKKQCLDLITQLEKATISETEITALEDSLNIWDWLQKDLVLNESLTSEPLSLEQELQNFASLRRYCESLTKKAESLPLVDIKETPKLLEEYYPNPMIPQESAALTQSLIINPKYVSSGQPITVKDIKLNFPNQEKAIVDGLFKDKALFEILDTSQAQWDKIQQDILIQQEKKLEESTEFKEIHETLENMIKNIYDRESKVIELKQVGKIRVFYPKKNGNLFLDATKLYANGLSLANAAAEIIHHGIKDEKTEKKLLGQIKGYLNTFRESLQKNEKKSVEQARALKVLSQQLSALLIQSEIVNDQKQAEAAIHWVSGFRLKSLFSDEIYCKVNLLSPVKEKEDKKEISESKVPIDHGVMLHLARPVTSIKSAQLVENYKPKNGLTDSLIKKIDPKKIWSDQFLIHHGDAHTQAWSSEASLTLLPLNPYEVTHVTMNSKGEMVRILNHQQAGFLEEFEIGDLSLAQKAAIAHHGDLVLGQDGKRLASAIKKYLTNQTLQPLEMKEGGKNCLVIPFLHHTLLDDISLKDEKGVAIESNKKAAHQALKKWLTENPPYYSNGEIYFGDTHAATALPIKMEVFQINDHIDLIGDLIIYSRDREEEKQMNSLLNIAAQHLKQLILEEPVSKKFDLLIEFLKADPVSQDEYYPESIETALAELTAILCDEKKDCSNGLLSLSQRRNYALLLQAAVELKASFRLKKDGDSSIIFPLHIASNVHDKSPRYRPRMTLFQATMTSIVSSLMGCSMVSCPNGLDRASELQAQISHQLSVFERTNHLMGYGDKLIVEESSHKNWLSLHPTQDKHDFIWLASGSPIAHDVDLRVTWSETDSGVLSNRESKEESQLSKEFAFIRDREASEIKTAGQVMTEIKGKCSEAFEKIKNVLLEHVNLSAENGKNSIEVSPNFCPNIKIQELEKAEFHEQFFQFLNLCSVAFNVTIKYCDNDGTVNASYETIKTYQKKLQKALQPILDIIQKRNWLVEFSQSEAGDFLRIRKNLKDANQRLNSYDESSTRLAVQKINSSHPSSDDNFLKFKEENDFYFRKSKENKKSKNNQEFLNNLISKLKKIEFSSDHILTDQIKIWRESSDITTKDDFENSLKKIGLFTENKANSVPLTDSSVTDGLSNLISHLKIVEKCFNDFPKHNQKEFKDIFKKIYHRVVDDFIPMGTSLTSGQKQILQDLRALNDRLHPQDKVDTVNKSKKACSDIITIIDNIEIFCSLQTKKPELKEVNTPDNFWGSFLPDVNDFLRLCTQELEKAENEKSKKSLLNYIHAITQHVLSCVDPEVGLEPSKKQSLNQLMSFQRQLLGIPEPLVEEKKKEKKQKKEIHQIKSNIIGGEKMDSKKEMQKSQVKPKPMPIYPYWSRAKKNKWLGRLGGLVSLGTGALMGVVAIGLSPFSFILSKTLPDWLLGLGAGTLGAMFGQKMLKYHRTDWCHVFADLPEVEKILSSLSDKLVEISKTIKDEKNNKNKANKDVSKYFGAHNEFLYEFLKSLLSALAPGREQRGRLLMNTQARGVMIENQKALFDLAEKIRHGAVISLQDITLLNTVMNQLKQKNLLKALPSFWDKHPKAKKWLIGLGTGLSVVGMAFPPLLMLDQFGMASGILDLISRNAIEFETVMEMSSIFAWTAMMTMTALCALALYGLQMWGARTEGQLGYTDYESFTQKTENNLSLKEVEPKHTDVLSPVDKDNKQQISSQPRSAELPTHLYITSQGEITPQFSLRGWFKEEFGFWDKKGQTIPFRSKLKWAVNVLVVSLMVGLLAYPFSGSAMLMIALGSYIGVQVLQKLISLVQSWWISSQASKELTQEKLIKPEKLEQEKLDEESDQEKVKKEFSVVLDPVTLSQNDANEPEEEPEKQLFSGTKADTVSSASPPIVSDTTGFPIPTNPSFDSNPFTISNGGSSADQLIQSIKDKNIQAFKAVLSTDQDNLMGKQDYAASISHSQEKKSDSDTETVQQEWSQMNLLQLLLAHESSSEFVKHIFGHASQKLQQQWVTHQCSVQTGDKNRLLLAKDMIAYKADGDDQGMSVILGSRLETLKEQVKADSQTPSSSSMMDSTSSPSSMSLTSSSVISSMSSSSSVPLAVDFASLPTVDSNSSSLSSSLSVVLKKPSEIEPSIQQIVSNEKSTLKSFQEKLEKDPGLWALSYSGEITVDDVPVECTGFTLLDLCIFYNRPKMALYLLESGKYEAAQEEIKKKTTQVSGQSQKNFKDWVNRGDKFIKEGEGAKKSISTLDVLNLYQENNPEFNAVRKILEGQGVQSKLHPKEDKPESLKISTTPSSSMMSSNLMSSITSSPGTSESSPESISSHLVSPEPVSTEGAQQSTAASIFHPILMSTPVVKPEIACVQYPESETEPNKLPKSQSASSFFSNGVGGIKSKESKIPKSKSLSNLSSVTNK